jgi:hypothetical protein
MERRRWRYGTSCAVYPSFPGHVVHTVREVAYCKPFRRLGNVSQSQVGLSLPNHQVNDDECLEDDGPSRVSQTELQRAKDFCDSSLTAVRRRQDCLDVLGFWRCELDNAKR